METYSFSSLKIDLCALLRPKGKAGMVMVVDTVKKKNLRSLPECGPQFYVLKYTTSRSAFPKVTSLHTYI